MSAPDIEEFARVWATDDPARVVGRGHPVGVAQATLIEHRA